MNKKALVLAVAAGLAAPVTFAAATADSSTSDKVHNNQDSVISAKTIYTGEKATLKLGGRAEARMSVVDGDVSDVTRVRFNLKGNVYLKNGLYGVGFYEAQYDHNTTNVNGLDHRYTYAGIGGDFGEVTYGQNDGALGQITDFTDIMTYHGGVSGEKLAAGDRAENMLVYKGGFDNLSVHASYRFEDAQMADGYSLSGVYGFGGFKAGLGFASQDEVDQFDVALSYETGGFYFAGLYMNLDEDISGFELAAAYTTGPYVFSTTYGVQEFDGDEIDEDIAIDVAYYFSTNFRTYASYNHTLMDGEEDEIALGLRYDF